MANEAEVKGSGRNYNIIIFGASGFTGKYLIEETVNFLREAHESEHFTWAVAGRSKNKLVKALAEISKNTGEDFSSVDTIIADVYNYESICNMAKQCDIVLNCVGPYLLWGEVVVNACLQERTHHLDLSGEVQYLETFQLKYSKEAGEKNVYIIAPCGLDSIPADLGTTYLKQNFGGDLNSVEIYLGFESNGRKSAINFGTFYSAVNFLSRLGELKHLHQQLNLQPLPKPKFKLTQRLLHYSNTVTVWCIPNPFPDQRIVERSQRWFYNEEKELPVKMKAYLSPPSINYALLFIFGSAFLTSMAQFQKGRYLLINKGTKNQEPKRNQEPEEMDHVKFTFTLVGKGWSDSSASLATAPNKIRVLEVKGTNPAYKATNVMFLHSALIMLKEGDKLPKKGVVYTPGVAFAKTSLVDRLNLFGKGESGVRFAFK